jgi:hypothetical protein
MLLSTQQMAPACLAMSEMARILHICILGLVGDSTMTSLVRPGIMAFLTASRSVMFTLLTLTPAFGTTWLSKCPLPLEYAPPS